MIISINQPAYMPWMGYFNRIANADLHVVLDHVQFEKNSFTNRNKIKTKDGLLWLTVPLKTKGLFGDLSINNIKIANDNWKNKHIKNLEYSYLKSPFYKNYEYFLKDFYKNDFVKLVDILYPMNSWLLEELEIKTPIIYSSNLNLSSSKSDLVLDICKFFDAKSYLSGPLGRDYLDIESFQKNKIEILYDDYVHPVYNQFNGAFESHLGILDLLFNCGPESNFFFKN